MFSGMQAVFDVLGEPNRRAILDQLVRGEQCVGDLEHQLELSQPAISKHLRVLREAGFVEARIEAQRRVYRIRMEPLIALDRWLEPYRRQWNTALDALERHLDRMPDTTPRRRRKGRTR
jgi:DNA-binding transcriptional ArsR family regulator